MRASPRIDRQILQGYDLITITTAHTTVDYEMVAKCRRSCVRLQERHQKYCQPGQY